MQQLILHHHDPSPFAEKIRLVFGLKGLEWSSVQVPMIMPKPDLTALTGGYRKAPVLQIGADIYCDTSLIARELEARFPEPSLFPAGHIGAGLTHSAAGATKPSSSRALDCRWARTRKSRSRSSKTARTSSTSWISTTCRRRCRTATRSSRHNAQLLEDELNEPEYVVPGPATSRPGSTSRPTFSVWMANTNIPRAKELLEPFPAITAWTGHMESIGRGDRTR